MENTSGLSDFLSDKLFSFVKNETDLLYASSHAYQPKSGNDLSGDIDSLLLHAIKNYENYEQASSITRQFSDLVSGENIEQAIKSAVPDSTRKDIKYCIAM